MGLQSSASETCPVPSSFSWDSKATLYGSNSLKSTNWAFVIFSTTLPRTGGRATANERGTCEGRNRSWSQDRMASRLVLPVVGTLGRWDIVDKVGGRQFNGSQQIKTCTYRESDCWIRAKGAHPLMDRPSAPKSGGAGCMWEIEYLMCRHNERQGMWGWLYRGADCVLQGGGAKEGSVLQECEGSIAEAKVGRERGLGDPRGLSEAVGCVTNGWL